MYIYIYVFILYIQTFIHTYIHPFVDIHMLYRYKYINTFIELCARVRHAVLAKSRSRALP